jgi:hypothetical protein
MKPFSPPGGSEDNVTQGGWKGKSEERSEVTNCQKERLKNVVDGAKQRNRMMNVYVCVCMHLPGGELVLLIQQ